MASPDLNELMQHLITGLEVLQDDYTLLFEQHAALEHKLANARDQYNELAKLYGQAAVNTPPLSLASAAFTVRNEEGAPLSAADVLNLRSDDEAARRLRAANDASRQLLARIKKKDAGGDVKIWSGPSADQSTQSNSRLPSIHESPMEQDFTVPGTPSRLGCPFASMTGRKLSSHAASVLSRYHGSQHDGKASSREPVSGNASIASRGPSRSSKRHSSIVDPIKAEICGLDSHSQGGPKSKPHSELEDAPPEGAAEVGVCPIRFLNQHSPEELATYFERHKHELPRSHEVCVRRYQSNQDQVRELDARYDNVAQMIRGLGEKHQSFLPKDPEEEALDIADEHVPHDDTRVQQWADSVDKQPAENEADPSFDENDDNSRESHFSRPLRDVRVGESPSRPWGISVPSRYLERKGSDASSVPAQIKAPEISPSPAAVIDSDEPAPKKPAARCPFASMAMGKTGGGEQDNNVVPELPEGHPPVEVPASEAASVLTSTPEAPAASKQGQQSVFNGPIVVGYSPEDAALFLKKLGYSR